MIRTLPLRAIAGCALGIAVAVQIADAQPTIDEFTVEVRTPFNLQLPTDEARTLALGAEGILYSTPRKHSEKYRSLFAEEVNGTTSMLRVGVSYEPHSDLRTGTRGYTAIVDGYKTAGGRWAFGAFARYSGAALEIEQNASDFELGPQAAWWSGQRVFVNEKLTFRSVSDALNPLRDPTTAPEISGRGEYVQLRHHLVYAAGEDWGFTYAHDLRLVVGTFGSPHANGIAFFNYFIWSPSIFYSFGPVMGVNMDYYVGRARSSLTIPVGVRLELFFGRFAAEIEGGYTIKTMAEQGSPGWLLRGMVGMRF